jgi:hypothetical protein
MRYESKEDYTFFYLTLCFGIFYTDDIDNFFENANECIEDLFGLEFLKMVEDVITRYSAKAKLSKQTISNIYEYVNRCRFNEEIESNQELKKQVYYYCNQILTVANSQSSNDNWPAIYEEISRRYTSRKDLIFKTFSYWIDSKRVIDSITNMRELDFLILCTHSEILDEEDFAEEIDYMLADPHYLVCLEYLLNTHPRLFSDNQFKQRALWILESNEHLISEAFGKPVKDCFYEITDEDDKKILTNRKFSKTNQKIKRKILNIKKDS